MDFSYVLITPHSIRKSRTGGIIARLLSRSGLELAAARMFAPSAELASRYADLIITDPDPGHRRSQEMIRDYVLKHFSPDSKGTRSRVMLLLLKGEDAVSKVRSVVGTIREDRTSGETIRDTFGDYVTDHGEVVYFEPAVLAPPTDADAAAHLRLWAAFSDSDGGILDKAVPYPAGLAVEKTLVLIKPDNFRFPNARPGAVIDVFSRTGLSIIGIKVHHMSVAEAEEFYAPVLGVLQEKLKDSSGKRARLAVEHELGVPLDYLAEKQLGDLLGPINGRANWESIVQFMAGQRPSDCPPEQREEPGTQKCLALIYQGIDAVRKIREVLGPTDPSKAPFGTIRKEFGQTIMINAAHASDSAENAAREMGIIKAAENRFRAILTQNLPN